jgi:uncharacterized SAM-binding protein YcdF (DUF218 family)
MKNKHKNMSGKYRKRLLFLCLPLLLILFLLLSAGRYLSLSQPPQQADAIIVLSGGWGRVEKGAELYSQHFAPHLLLSNASESGAYRKDMQDTALSLGIPQDAILTENEALSTYQNAELTLPIMQEQGLTSAIVVSSDFHMRRVKFIFDHVYKDSGIKLTYIGADSSYNAKWWWSDRRSRETTFNEYVKMIGNAIGYNGPEAKDTLREIKQWFQ